MLRDVQRWTVESSNRKSRYGRKNPNSGSSHHNDFLDIMLHHNYFIFNDCVDKDSILKMQSEYSIVSA